MAVSGVVRAAAAAGVIVLGAFSVAGPSGAGEPVRWRMASVFPGDLLLLGTLGTGLSSKLERVSGGAMRLEFFEPNEIVPTIEMFDATASGAIEAAWSTPGYWFGKEPALVMFSAVPFGPDAGEFLAWIYRGGGHDMMNEIYHRHNIHGVICGVMAPEASGWFLREIRSIADLQGLRMRFSGLGAKVMERLGVSTQLIAGGNIYPAFEAGSIDAAEYSMPAIDIDLELHRIAKHYYFPGWHQQAMLFDLMINLDKWNALDETQKAQIEISCGDNIRESIAEGEAIQGRMLAALEAQGVTTHRWPPEILAELERAWGGVAGELAEWDEDFKRVWASYRAFREEYAPWRALRSID